MPLPKLNLDIPQEGYSFTDGEAVLRARVSAGPSRQRLDMLGAPAMVDLSMVLEQPEYNYWRSFYRSSIVLGSLPFIVDLITESSDMAEHEAKIIPGSVQMTVQGTAHIVRMQLEIKTVAADEDYDEALVLFYDLYGDDAAAIIAMISDAAHDWPRFTL